MDSDSAVVHRHHMADTTQSLLTTYMQSLYDNDLVTASPMLNHCTIMTNLLMNYYGRTLSERPSYILPMFFYRFFVFFMPALVGQTAERIFTKLSHVVDIRHHL